MSGGLIGLSILTGGNAFQSIGTIKTDTAKVLAAKAQFKTPPTTALWDLPPTTMPEDVEASTIRGMDTIIDKPNDDESAGSDDVETSFIAYKALDRLRILAKNATSADLSDAERTSYEKAFAKGLADLQDFLAGAPGDLVSLAFGDPSSTAEGAGIAATQDISKVPGKGVVSDLPRDPDFSPASLDGDEVLAIDVGDDDGWDRAHVDLRTAGSPPTAAGIQQAINDAIAAFQTDPTTPVAVNPDGSLALDDLTDATVLQFNLDNGSDQDKVTVDLAQLATQPPTRQAIADAVNHAIGALHHDDGSGNSVPRYAANVTVDPGTGALVLDAGTDTVTVKTSEQRYQASYAVADNGDGTFALTGNPAGNTLTVDQAPTPGYSLPIPGVSGDEVLVVDLSKGANTNATVRVNLADLAQPPTLQSVADALNQAIRDLGNATNPDGTTMLDSKGKPVPLYSTQFRATRGENGAYGLSADAGANFVTMHQENSNDALIVVNSQTQYDAPGGARVSRVTDALDALERKLLGSVSATDRKASADAAAREKARVAAAEDSDDAATETDTTSVAAALTAQGSVTDSDGNTYIVGTTPGDLGTHHSDGGDDLFVAKVDSEGNVVWQQTLGVAGEAQGAVISLTADGGIVVAGSVTGEFDGNMGTTGSDMLVARFDATGTRQFATSIPSPGEDFATALTIDPADGSIYLGGKSDIAHGGDAYIAHLGGDGKMIEQQKIDSTAPDGTSKGTNDTITAFALDADGNLLALTHEDGYNAKLRRIDKTDLTNTLESVDLGSADARTIAVEPGANGRIVIAGATLAPVPIGTQANAFGGNRDGFVIQFDAGLDNAVTTYIGSRETVVDDDGAGPHVASEKDADDQIDSVTFMNGNIYVGGRTSGNLTQPRQGKVDGFIGLIDSDGAVQKTTQFGSPGTTSDAVHVTTSVGGDNILGALGLRSGELNGEISTSLSSQLGLSENDTVSYVDAGGQTRSSVIANGDTFSVQIDGHRAEKITIDPGESVTSLSLKIQELTGGAARVTTGVDANGNRTIGFSVSEGHTLGLIAGADGRDALAKFGLGPTRLHSALPRDPKSPAVTPGGDFGLNLNLDLSLDTKEHAKAALDAITSAISMTQTAYRSLYWDDGKAALVNGAIGGGTAYQQKQLANYQAALTRLSAGPGTGFSLF